MNSIECRHIVIGLVVAFILFLFCGIDDYYSFENPGGHTLIQPQSSYRSFDSERIYSSHPSRPQIPSSLNRNETLQTKVKGYRKVTYWGEEHLQDEKIRYLSDDEFDRFIIDEVELKDEDVYWGAEY